MSPSISSEEIAVLAPISVPVPGRLSSSRRWLLQVALLFGLLLLGHWSRHASLAPSLTPSLAVGTSAPRWRLPTTLVVRRAPLVRPAQPAVGSVAFERPGR